MNTAHRDDIKLHIGGVEPREGWSILNVTAGPHVDYVGNCNNLSFLADACCAEVYASHVLEHLGYDGELQQTLREIYRVLKPGGRLRVSVPDLEVLCRLFLRPDLEIKDRHHVMKMMFGGRVDEYDVHKCGLSLEFMARYLHDAGFRNITRVDVFGEFNDASAITFVETRISLNLKAYKAQ